MALCRLECRIGFVPLLRSRRLVQQHPIPACKMKPTSANPVAIHMKTNILSPTEASILRDDCAVAAYLKTKLMTEAMIDAAKISIKVIADKMAIGKDHHREKMATGDRKASTKARTVPVRKNANIR